MTAKATLIAAAWMVKEPMTGFWTSDLMRFINDGGGGMFEEPELGPYYPAEIRRTCYRLKDAGYLLDVSWGRFMITGRGWEKVLALTGGKGLL